MENIQINQDLLNGLIAITGAIAGAIATLIAAYVGASRAFMLQTRKDEASIRRTQIGSLLNVLFVLARQRQYVLRIKDGVLQPFTNSSNRHFQLTPFVPVVASAMNINIASIEFLLETNEKNALVSIMDCNAIFDEAIQACCMRAQFYKTDLVPALDKLDIRKSPNINDLSPLLTSQLAAITNEIYAKVDSFIEISESTLKQLPPAFQKIHSEVDFQKFINDVSS